jgi:hypothetical protein
MVTETKPTESTAPRAPEPVVIELGERSNKQISKLRQGRGRIRREIDGVLSELQQSGDVAEDAQVVVVVVKRRASDEDACWWG